MPFYNSIDELINSITKQKQSELQSSLVSPILDAPRQESTQRAIQASKDIKAGTYVPVPIVRPQAAEEQQDSGFKSFLKATSGSFAQGVVNTTRSLASQFEREITSTMSDPNATIADNLKGFAQRMMQSVKEGDESGKSNAKVATEIMLDLASQFVYKDPGALLSANPMYRFYKGMTSLGQTEANKALKPAEEKIAEWADVENRSFATKIVAGALQSLPQTLLTRGGIATAPIMLTNAYQNSMEGLIAEGKDPKDKATFINAMGSAAVEVASEYMFGLFKGAKIGAKELAKTAGKQTAKQAILLGTKGFLDGFLDRGAKELIKPTLLNFVKFVGIQGAEEGLEEVVSYLGSTLIASMTTHKEQGFGELFSFEELARAGLTGAFAGMLMTTASQSRAWVNTNKAAVKIADKPMKDITKQEFDDIVNGTYADMKTQEAQEEVASAVSDSVAQAEQANQQSTVDAEIDRQMQAPELSIDEQIAQLTEFPDTLFDANGNVVKADAMLPAQKPVEAPTSPSQEQVVSDAVQPVQEASDGVQEATQELSGEQAEPEAQAVAQEAKPTPIKQQNKVAKEYYSYMLQKDGKPNFVKQDNAKPIVVDAMPNEDFFIRSSGDKSKTWTVVHAKTGLSIASVSTRKGAIEKANAMIAQFGVAEIQNKIAAAISKNGVSPAYAGQPTAQAQTTQLKTEIKVSEARATKAEPEPEAVEKPKTVQAKADTAPQVTVSMKDIAKMYGSGMNVEEAVKQWADSPEAEKKFGHIKTKQDVAAEALKLKRDIDGAKVLTKDATGDGYLQMLALKAWADRIGNVPDGTALSLYMVNMVSAMREQQPDKLRKKLENAVKDSDLYHEVLAQADVVMQAKKDVDEGGQDYIDALDKKMANPKYSIEPRDVVAISMWAKKLADNGDVVQSQRLLKKLAKRMTQYGQVIRAIGTAYEVLFPEYYAAKIGRTFKESAETDKDTIDIESGVKETADVLSGHRKDAMRDAIKDAEKEAQTETQKKDTPEQQKDKKFLSPEERLAQEIKRDMIRSAQDQTPAKKSVEQKLQQWLFKKYADQKPKTDKRRTNIFEIVAEIVLNKDQYAEVWEGAQRIIASDTALQESVTARFLAQFADPVVADSFLRRVVYDNVAAMDKSMSQMAFEYFKDGRESWEAFAEQLVENTPNLDDAGHKYLKKWVFGLFVTQMDKRRALAQIALRKQVARKLLKKDAKTTQEAMINKLLDATYKDALTIEELRPYWEAYLGVPQLTPEMTKDIYDTVTRISKMDEAAQNKEYEALAKRLGDLIPVTNIERWLAWTRMSMLLNPVTWIRNMTSNFTAMTVYRLTDVIDNVIRKGMNLPVEYQLQGDKWVDYKGASYIAQTVRDWSTDERMRTETVGTQKMSFLKILGYEKKHFNNVKLERLSKIAGEVMNEGRFLGKNVRALGDMMPFAMHYKPALAQYLARNNFNEIMSKQQQQDLLEKGSKHAAEIALVRVFRTHTGLSSAIQSLKSKTYSREQIGEAGKTNPERARSMVRANKIRNTLVTIAIPFVVTPAALVTQSYKFSPANLIVSLARLGIVKSTAALKGVRTDPSTLADISANLAQSTTGTVLAFGAGMLLGLLGLATGAAPDNEKERMEWDMQGKREYSIYIPGIGWFSIDWLAPLSSTLMFGAAFGSTAREDGLPKAFLNAPEDFVNSFVSSTLLNTVSRLSGGKFQSTTEKVMGFAMSGAYQFMPALLLRLNRIVDPYVRNTYSKNALEAAFMRVVSYLPVASLALPIDYDIWGRPVKKSLSAEPLASFERAILNLVSPFTFSADRTDNVTRAVIDIHDAVQAAEGNIAIPSAPDRLEGMTAKDYAEYCKDVGKMYYQAAQYVTAQGGLSDVQKAKLLAKKYSEARATVKKVYEQKQKNK